MEYNSNIKIWKDFPDFEGLYQACTDGQVRSVDHNTMGKDGEIHHIKGRILKPSTDKDGYLYVILLKNNIRYTKKIHKIIATTFIPNPNNLPVINHKNEIKDDNRVENLEWCTVQYNSNYGTVRDRIREKKHATMGIPIVQLTVNGDVVKIWKSAAIASDFGYSRSCINSCLKGRNKTHKGFKWMYLKDYEK